MSGSGPNDEELDANEAENLDNTSDNEESPTEDLFTGVEEPDGVVVEEAEEESDQSNLSDAFAEVLQEDGIDSIVEPIGEFYREYREDEREHNRKILRQEMNYNLILFGGLTIAVMLLALFTTLNPITALAYIAGIATGFGTHSTLNTIET